MVHPFPCIVSPYFFQYKLSRSAFGSTQLFQSLAFPPQIYKTGSKKTTVQWECESRNTGRGGVKVVLTAAPLPSYPHAKTTPGPPHAGV
ncbi:hypothetical protein GN956_G24743 [Arapaima gigas]